jgi:hypothetical protein
MSLSSVYVQPHEPSQLLDPMIIYGIITNVCY